MKRLILMVVVAIFTTVVGIAAAERPVEHRNSANTELTQTLDWREANLILPYPEEWTLVGQSGFDFVLVSYVNEQTGNEFIAMQSQSLPTDMTLHDFLVGLAEESGIPTDDLVEIEVGEREAWLIEQVSQDQATFIVGFSPDDKRIGLLLMGALSEDWEAWREVYTQILAEATISTFTLDHTALNEQLQQSLETNGTLTVGASDAPITLVEFMDFSCPHCADYRYAINRIVYDYVISGTANLSIGVLTFVGGEFSELAASYQYCGAKLGIGWDMHELLFDEYFAEGGAQNAYTSGNLSEAVENAEFELDLDTFNSCLEDEAAISEFLQSTSNLAAELEVGGTPTMVVGTSPNDLKISESRTLLFLYEEIERLVQASQ